MHPFKLGTRLWRDIPTQSDITHTFWRSDQVIAFFYTCTVLIKIILMLGKGHICGNIKCLVKWIKHA